uniref:Uncharacterized protein n=2 Tax=Panagrolaimus sp. JU765 TaxID=591449 RepID=A0AC34RC72_9BILA
MNNGKLEQKFETFRPRRGNFQNFVTARRYQFVPADYLNPIAKKIMQDIQFGSWDQNNEQNLTKEQENNVEGYFKGLDITPCFIVKLAVKGSDSNEDIYVVQGLRRSSPSYNESLRRCRDNMHHNSTPAEVGFSKNAEIPAHSYVWYMLRIHNESTVNTNASDQGCTINLLFQTNSPIPIITVMFAKNIQNISDGRLAVDYFYGNTRNDFNDPEFVKFAVESRLPMPKFENNFICLIIATSVFGLVILLLILGFALNACFPGDRKLMKERMKKFGQESVFLVTKELEDYIANLPVELVDAIAPDEPQNEQGKTDVISTPADVKTINTEGTTTGGPTIKEKV